MEEILNVKEAAKWLRVSPVSLYRGLKVGRSPSGLRLTVNGDS